jgi:hypothetical protein
MEELFESAVWTFVLENLSFSELALTQLVSHAWKSYTDTYLAKDVVWTRKVYDHCFSGLSAQTRSEIDLCNLIEFKKKKKNFG